MTHDAILGIDFCKEMQMDVRLGERLWRVQKNESHEFSTGINRTEDGDIFAECAGISEVTETQRDRVQGLVDQLVLPQFEEHGMTSMTEHSISVTDTTQIKYRSRRIVLIYDPRLG